MHAYSAPLLDDQHWATLSALTSFDNEAAVEHLLVMPLLEALGFVRTDIAQKVPVTFISGTKRGRPFEADFVTYSGALHDRDTSLMVVEVKALNKPLEDAREQGESYAFQLRAPVLLVTNGKLLQVWQLQVSQESTLVLEIAVTALMARRAELERAISKQALLHHAESLAFKKLTPTTNFSAYERAELARTQGPAIPRRLKAERGEVVNSTALLESCSAGALIIGPSGYGKTVLSQQLLTAAIKNRWTTPNAPVVADIPLIDFAQSEYSVMEFFCHRVTAQQPEVTLASVEKAARDHGVVVVCDGLEYVSHDQLPSVESRLRLFKRDFPSGQLFVFSRATVPVSLSLMRLTLEPLNGEERHMLALAVTGKEFFLWRMPKLLQDLGEVPLLLRRIIEFHVERNTFPSRLEDLFEHWLSQLRNGLAGTPAAKARLDSALLSIARELAYRRMSAGDALAVVVAAGFGSDSFDDLVHSGAVVLTESSISIVHDSLGDYLRARALTGLPYEAFRDSLTQMSIQDDSMLPVLLVVMTQDRAYRQLVWKRLETLSLHRYIDTIRFGQASDQQFSIQHQETVPFFLADMIEGIEAMLRGFIPDISSSIRAILAHTLIPVDAITLRGDIDLTGQPEFVYTIAPSVSGISGVEHGFPSNEHWWSSTNLKLAEVGQDGGRYMAACAVRDALTEVILRRTFRGGAVLANERALGRLRKLNREYGWPLAPDDSLPAILDRLLPHADKFVSQSPWRSDSDFTIQSVIDDLNTLVRAGHKTLDWWWLPFGSNEQEIFTDPTQAKAYLRAHYSRVTALYAEIVRASFGRVATAFPFFNAMPFRWEILIKSQPSAMSSHHIRWQWMPVANESEAEPLCFFENETPEGLFNAESLRSRLRAELARFDRHLGDNYVFGGSGGFPGPDASSLNRQNATETSAMAKAAEMIANDVKALFRELPS